MGRFSNDLGMICAPRKGPEANRGRWSELWLLICRDRFRDQLFAFGDFVFDFGIRSGLSFEIRSGDQTPTPGRCGVRCDFSFGDIGHDLCFFLTSPSEIRAMWSERVANDLKRSIIPFDLTSPSDITASPSEIWDFDWVWRRENNTPTNPFSASNTSPTPMLPRFVKDDPKKSLS